MPASVPRVHGPEIIFQALRGESARGGKKKPERTRSGAKLTRQNTCARAQRMTRVTVFFAVPRVERWTPRPYFTVSCFFTVTCDCASDRHPQTRDVQQSVEEFVPQQRMTRSAEILQNCCYQYAIMNISYFKLGESGDIRKKFSFYRFFLCFMAYLNRNKRNNY